MRASRLAHIVLSNSRKAAVEPDAKKSGSVFVSFVDAVLILRHRLCVVTIVTACLLQLQVSAVQ